MTVQKGAVLRRILYREETESLREGSAKTKKGGFAAFFLALY